jgi:diguanylate cyclase (GGDEF)-like protein
MDGHKRINDTHGHDEGSRAITAAAEVLRRTFRDSDVVARLGGDEFAVLVVEPGEHGTESFAERLTEGLAHYNEGSGAPYAVAMSVGASRFDGSHTIEEAVARADELMYQEKRRKGADRKVSAATLTPGKLN